MKERGINMQDIIGIIQHEKDLQKMHMAKLNLGLRGQRPGYLIKRRNSFIWRYMKDGKVEEVYLGTNENDPIVRQLKEQRYMAESKKIIENNLILMDGFLKKYKNYDPETVSKGISRAYEIPPEKVFETMGLISPNTWAKDFVANDEYPEHLKHTTSRGEKVRSKSEVIIANQLYLNGIDYRYEWKEWYGRNIISPDFKLFHPVQHRLFLWEHLGMLLSLGYLDSALWKLQRYYDCGFVLWDNLIVTFDDQDGNLDSRVVSKLIDLYLK